MRCLEKAKNQQGIFLIIGAVALVGVFVVVGIIYDFGMWYLTRGELRTIADTAALRGAKELGAIYLQVFNAAATDPDSSGTDPIAAQNNLGLTAQQVTDITTAITNVVNQHKAGGEQITIASADLQIGLWNETTRVFTPGLGPTPPPNAVQVTARRETGSNAGPLNLIFGPFLNIDILEVAPATSIAALTPLNRVPPNLPASGFSAGDIIFPLGVDEDFLSPAPAGDFCQNGNTGCNVTGTNPAQYFNSCILIQPLMPQPSCFAWTTYNDPDPTVFQNIINGDPGSPMTQTINDGDYNPSDSIFPIPPPKGAPSYYFHGDAGQGGEIIPPTSGSPLLLLSNHPALGGVPTNSQLEVLLPVYRDNATGGCAIPNGTAPLPIVGFVSARLKNRSPFSFQVKFGCGAVRTGRSGERSMDPVSGNPENFGTLGSEPVLVQ